MDQKRTFKENIFKWYPFEENANAVLYAKDAEYQEILQEKVRLVSEETEENLNYIILIGEKEIDSKMERLANRMTDETKVIIIGENDLSAQNISHYPKVEQILQKKELCTIEKWQQQMKNLGFVQDNLYYVFPNYEFADMLFKDSYPMEKEQIERYIPNFREGEIGLFDEIEFLRKIIEIDKNLLKVFANAYFIEFTKKGNSLPVEYVSFNNTRKEEYRLMTVIKEDVVEKVAVSRKAETHLENAKKNVEILQKQKIHLLDTIENGKYGSQRIRNGQTLDIVLAEKKEDLDFIAKQFLKIRDILEEQAIGYNDDIEKSLQKYEIDTNKLKGLKFLENAMIDFVPKNCFLLEGEMYFFDQEWCEKFLPVDFILYRGIINCYGLVKKMDPQKLYERLGLTEYIACFEKINQKIMDKILDHELYEEIFEKEIRKMDNVINDQKIALEQIKHFQAEDVKKDQVIQTLQEEDAKKVTYIADLENIIADLQEEEKNKANYIETLESIKKSKEEEIQQLQNIDLEKDKTIQNLNEIIKVKDNQIAVFENMKTVKLIKKLRGNK